MRVMRCLTAVVLGSAFAMLCSTALAAEPRPFSAAELAYPTATIKTRIEVSGVSAGQLIGGALTAYTYQLQADARAAEEAGASEKALSAIAQKMSSIDEVRDTVTSFLGFMLVVMKPGEPVKAANFVAHYQHLMGPRGWSPLATVQDEENQNAIVFMLAPNEKGLFVALGSTDEILTGLVTTSKPLGELLARIFHTAEGADPMDQLVGFVTQAAGRPRANPAAPQPEQAPAPEEE
jgi:hypothetical protein